MNQPEPLAPGDAELLEAGLRDAVRVEPLALESEFVRMSGDLAYWTARNAVAIGVHLRAKARAKRLRALLFLEARETPEPEPEPVVVEAPEEGKKAKKVEKPKAPPRVTEKDAEARAELDPRWQDAQEAEIVAEVEREKMKGAVAALVAKKDMLVQLGANQRAELERDPVVRERHFADRLGRQ